MTAATILVTGGAGYIGSHACKALAARGHRPVTLDNLSRGHRWAVKFGPLEEGDIADAAFVRAVLERHRPAVVLHFAAYAYVGESVADPLLYYRNNLAGSLTLLEAMRDTGTGQLVFSSTCATYGVPERLPIDETHPLAPINPYGRTKLAVERMIADAEAAHGPRSVIFRYFNAAGADPDGALGEVHDPEPHLIPRVLDAARGRLEAIEVHGADYPTPDGTCVRDYIHVTDLAEAHALGVEYLLDGGGSTVLNLGTGQGASVREVIAAAERVTGRPVPVRAGPRRPGDPPVLVADATRVRTVLGWTPRYPDIDTQIAHAWGWEAPRGVREDLESDQG